jgi:hypothetical protein
MGTSSIFSYKCFVLKLHQPVLSGLLKPLDINSKFTKFKTKQNWFQTSQTNKTGISKIRKKEKNRKKRSSTPPRPIREDSPASSPASSPSNKPAAPFSLSL